MTRAIIMVAVVLGLALGQAVPGGWRESQETLTRQGD